MFIFITDFSNLQIEKSLYYWEKDSCTVPVCVRMLENSVRGGSGGYVHGLKFVVSSRYGVYLALLRTTSLVMVLLLFCHYFY